MRQLVENTKTALLETVDELKWISDLGKSIVVQQIEAMNIDIPYIHVTRNAEDLEDVYAEVRVSLLLR